MSKYTTKIAGHILTAANNDDERRNFYLLAESMEKRVAQTSHIKDLALEYLQDVCGVTMRKNASASIVTEALLYHCLKLDKMWIGKDMELDRVARALVDYEQGKDL